jgi:small subunit ribosomal protein S18
MEKTYEKKSGGGDRGSDRGDRGERGEGDEKRRGFTRRKVCRFCADTKIIVDFKDQSTLKYFVTERGKIIPRRISGNCSLHQRAIARAIKQSRGLALIPYLVVAG